MLFIKPGKAEPEGLPFDDVDDDDQCWSDLANSPEGRAACGWVEAPAKPVHDPVTERVEWQGGFEGGWRLIGRVPSKVSRLQLRLELYDRGLLDDVEALVAAGGPIVGIYWADSSEFHIDHPVLVALVTQGGWSQTLLNDVFTSAKART